ncbi:hypothetical protein HMPREF1989_01884 [Porphyromonas gingivalis F0566]|nr:hypothetical protein HMPREF1989_01884 [Porphyromonas gingivalis F0566]
MHHTGIKTDVEFDPLRGGILFQLHHTGIKTMITSLQKRKHTKFQLHHTGIKTADDGQGDHDYS